MTLEKIYEPIYSELNNFEVQFKSALNSKVDLLKEVVDYIISYKGKRLRPILLFLTANIVGKASLRTTKAAILVELLHTATLLHDDVVDESDLRRGVPTVNTTWRNKVAILAGDFLFATVLQSLVEIGNDEIFKILSTVTQRMSEGELLQIERNRDYTMDETIYYRMIADKTASLIAATCQLGALTAEPAQSPQIVETLRKVGESLGIAFQIKDDLLDYVGEQKIIGKPTGNDIIENKITLPLLYSLKRVSEDQRKKIIEIFENGNSASQIETIQNFVKQHGGLDYAQKQADFFIGQATSLLAKFPDSTYKSALDQLTQYVIHREK